MQLSGFILRFIHFQKVFIPALSLEYNIEYNFFTHLQEIINNNDVPVGHFWLKCSNTQNSFNCYSRWAFEGGVQMLEEGRTLFECRRQIKNRPTLRRVVAAEKKDAASSVFGFLI